jgi:hypothetical protein
MRRGRSAAHPELRLTLGDALSHSRVRTRFPGSLTHRSCDPRSAKVADALSELDQLGALSFPDRRSVPLSNSFSRHA